MSGQPLLGARDLLDLLARLHRLDVWVRCPLSQWVTGPRFINDADHPRVQALKRAGRMRRSRVGPRQRAGEITLLKPGKQRSSRRGILGKVLVSTLRSLEADGLAWLQRNERGNIMRVEQPSWRRT